MHTSSSRPVLRQGNRDRDRPARALQGWHAQEVSAARSDLTGTAGPASPDLAGTMVVSSPHTASGATATPPPRRPPSRAATDRGAAPQRS